MLCALGARSPGLLLLNLFNDGCQNVSCPGKSKVVNTKMEGSVLRASWTRT